eukprot:GILK01007759.1.p1 GENE.GILK01007759.1~~GILK01007759.1.p1  ORF type:complete len:1050 (+),score=162.39 GILK01007759.1:338-3151(+)
MSLRSLNLNGNAIQQAGAEALAEALVHNSTLTKLNVRWNSLTAAGELALAKACMQSRSLRDIAGVTLNLFADMLSLPDHLKQASNEQIFSYLHEVGTSPSRPSSALILNGFPTTVASSSVATPRRRGYGPLDGFHSSNSSSDLSSSFSSSPSTNSHHAAARPYLSETEKRKRITDLMGHLRTGSCGSVDMTGWALGPEYGRLFAELISWQKFKELNLFNNSLGDEGAKVIANSLTRNVFLSKLVLGCNGITDEGATKLAMSLRDNQGLKSLDLSGNGIQSGGAFALAQMLLTNRCLSRINIRYNSIGQDGFEAIAKAAERNKKLKSILGFNLNTFCEVLQLPEALRSASNEEILQYVKTTPVSDFPPPVFFVFESDTPHSPSRRSMTEEEASRRKLAGNHSTLRRHSSSIHTNNNRIVDQTRPLEPPSGEYQSWNVYEVGSWLSWLELNQYQQAFQDASIDGRMLDLLQESDLIELHLSNRFHRVKLLSAVADMRSTQQAQRGRLEEELKKLEDARKFHEAAMNRWKVDAQRLEDERRRLEMERSKLAVEMPRIRSLVKYSMQDIELATDNFSAESFVRACAGGLLYRGHIAGRSVAITKVESELINSLNPAQLLSQLEYIFSVSHPNVAPLIGVALTNQQEERCLVHLYEPGDTLHDALFPSPDGPQPAAAHPSLTWQTRIRIAADIARALAALHTADPPLLHLNLHPAAILLTKRRAQIAEVGMSQLITLAWTEGLSHLSLPPPVMGAPGYTDPSTTTTLQVSPKNDVYSFGIILLQLLTRLPATIAQSAEDSAPQMDLGSRVAELLNSDQWFFSQADTSAGKWPTEVVQNLANLIRQCLDTDIVRRMDMQMLSKALDDLEAIGQVAALALNDSSASGDENKPLCAVCMDAPPVLAIIPCGHRCLCVSCGDLLLRQQEACPLCRKPVEKVLHIFE